MSLESRDDDQSSQREGIQIVPGHEYYLTDARILNADVRINAETSAHLVPKPLKLSEPAMATFYVADFPRTAREGYFYREAGVFLHVEDEKGPARFCPWMVVDNDEALIRGREAQGFPKKMAEITLVEDGDKVTASVIRKGVEVIRFDTTLGESIEDPHYHSFASHRNVNAIGIPLTGMRLIDSPAAGERIHQGRHASGTLAVKPSERDPLSLMEPAQEVGAQHLRADIGGARAGEATLTTDVDREWIERNNNLRSL